MKLMKGVNGISMKDIEGMVHSPPHYTVGGYEALDVIRAKLTPEEYRGYCKGNVLKYIMRSNYKGHHDQDIGKALFYLEELDDGLKSTTHWEDEIKVREERGEDPF